jgi:O-antigen/teichoic acid export membrane protein
MKTISFPSISSIISKKTSLIMIRMIALCFKFLLIVTIAKQYGMYELGVVSIFQAILMCSVFLIGFDIYSYCNREVIDITSEAEKNELFGIHVIFMLIGMAIWFIPVLFLSIKLLPKHLIIITLLIILFEYLNTEIYRYKISLKMPIHANVNLLLRNGLLGALLYILFFFNIKIDFYHIFIIWFSLELICFLYGTILLKNQFISFTLYNSSNFENIKIILRSAVPMYLASGCLRIIEYLDRFFIESILDKESLGVYTWYFSIANVSQIICYTAVILENFPKLVKKRNETEFNRIFIKLRRRLLIWSSAISLVLAIVLLPMTHYIGKKLSFEEILLFTIMLISNTILCTSWSYYYHLYIGGKESLIFKSNAIQLLSMGFLLTIFTPIYGIIGASFSVLLSTTIGCFIKRYYVKAIYEL